MREVYFLGATIVKKAIEVNILRKSIETSFNFFLALSGKNVVPCKNSGEIGHIFSFAKAIKTLGIMHSVTSSPEIFFKHSVKINFLQD